ncbi:MAG: HAMP domain-containing histidine kinase [Ktedonobacterales bacterium]|nr:HAMP domain-containing histidine kinase [Ktedonobacterales bacterium]
MWQNSQRWMATQWGRARALGARLRQQAFSIDVTDFAAFTPQAIMERRHRAFLQLVLVGCCVLLVFMLLFQIVFLRQTPLFMRLSVLCSFCITVVCLRLSFTQWARMAYAVYFTMAFTWMLAYAHLDPSGLSVRTVLAHAYLAPLLLGISLFLPRRFVPWVSSVLIVIAFASVMLLRVRHSLGPEIRYPPFTSATFLLVLDLLTWALAWGWERSMESGIAALQQAYLRERALDESKDEFLHIASHELRSPLTPIMLSSQLLEKRIRDGRPADELLELLTTLQLAGKRMQTMAELLLDVTRIDISRFTLQRQPCDLIAIMRDAVQTQESQRRRTVRLSGGATPLMVPLDENRIWQVLTNLLSNAMKYTPADGVVEVSVAASASDVRVSITDQGPGIPPEAMEHLFERYYQLPDHDYRKDEGFGLGLYICQQIVEAHGGRIWVESSPGHGACFSFTLPVTSTPVPAHAEPAANVTRLP